jgi:hypothetical protein
MIHLFGIRHHGPGCARSLREALDELSPDCLLIEGPPEAEAVLASAAHAEIEPPVALLLYCPEDTRKASFYPFAEFSPEWQAIRFGLQRSLPVRFMDLPQTHDLALRDAAAGHPLGEEGENSEEFAEDTLSGDPLDWLGRAAGYGDGESWWNHLVEERRDGDSAGLFAAIQEAMTVARSDFPRKLTAQAAHREALREAHMRKTIREAEKEGLQRIAVVCGAWHVPALAEMPSAKSDNELLKGLPKVKVAATWAPWTYGRLAASSGYGAGVFSPGWYEFLWRNQSADASQRSITWLSRVARLMREEEVDCSSAHVIEAVRLSDALAAMRDRPAAGLDEINGAIRTVICMGDDAPLRLIHSRLIVGEKLGRVPPDVPTVPLQQDLEKQQRSLRLKPEALAKELDLDLRNENDLNRSHLLHRLTLLDVPWGEVRGTGRGAKGTFHEVWQIRWQPEFAVSIIEASRWGHTLVDAASALAVDQAEKATSLPALSSLVDRVLLANLPLAVAPVIHALENLAALAGDAAQLLEAIPPLANIFRYGNVRQTDSSIVGHVLDGLVTRASISLGGSCASLDDDAATVMRKRILAAHQAIQLIDKETHLSEWMAALSRLAVLGGSHGLVCGLAARLLFDAQHEDAGESARRMSQALSIGNDPAPAAAWLEGFLYQSGMIILHDDRLWQTVDSWLSSLSEDHFTRILPLIRRTFSEFPAAERIQIGARATRKLNRQGTGAPPLEADWNEDRAVKPLPVLERILGL